MFSSFDLVVMCFFITIFLYLYWRATKSGTRLVLGFPIPKGQKRSDLITDIIMLVNTLILFGFLTWNIFANKNYSSDTPGGMGLNAGFVIGIGMILYATFSQWFVRSSKVSVFKVVLMLLLLLASIPSIANRLAQIEAKTDIEKFPRVVLISEEKLPPQLQVSSSTPAESIEVKLIITNNGMTYVLEQDSESTDEWQIYAIQEDDIKQIIYLHGK